MHRLRPSQGGKFAAAVGPDAEMVRKIRATADNSSKAVYETMASRKAAWIAGYIKENLCGEVRLSEVHPAVPMAQPLPIKALAESNQPLGKTTGVGRLYIKSDGKLHTADSLEPTDRALAVARSGSEGAVEFIRSGVGRDQIAEIPKPPADPPTMTNDEFLAMFSPKK